MVKPTLGESVVSTASSFNDRSQTAPFYPDRQEVNQIGSGLQGAIFEVVGHTHVFKKENPGNELLSSNLKREYKTHRDVSAAFELYKIPTLSIVQVPKPNSFVPKIQNKWFWDYILPVIPQGYRTRGDIITMERILPLPKVVRRALLTHFYAGERNWGCSKPDVEYLLSNQENKHCLARVYLGKANCSFNQDNPAPLRKFPLYLNSMKGLGMDTLVLAQEMGKTYAIMHWGAATNGDDVEFVLGTWALKKSVARIESSERSASCHWIMSSQLRPILEKPGIVRILQEGNIDAGNVILSDKKLNDKFSMEDFMQ
ncbi:hypothetical protein N7481_002777 [Penicillium waksmanii]|uniref:uncharacterized protein n=1 Tax=Penicillium waksmanii TaxID=69791 RepID=UPI0025482E17|nr:uncharacterized protein N7481_002777 [Penicillium waksmanii]KAJ5995800.1 hypothetical protein N7481_002777 [Penicillium waksmanii]